MAHYPYRPIALCTSMAPEFSAASRTALQQLWCQHVHSDVDLMTTYLNDYFKLLTYHSNGHMTCIAIRSQVDDGNTGCLLNCKLTDRVAALVFNTGIVTSNADRVFIVVRAQPSHWFNGQAMGDICTSKHTTYQHTDFADGSYLSTMWYVSDIIVVAPGADLKWNYCTISNSSLPVRPPGPGIDVPSASVVLAVAQHVKVNKAMTRLLERRVDLCSSTPAFMWDHDQVLSVLLVHVDVGAKGKYLMVLDDTVVAIVDVVTARVAMMVAGYY